MVPVLKDSIEQNAILSELANAEKGYVSDIEPDYEWSTALAENWKNGLVLP